MLRCQQYTAVSTHRGLYILPVGLTCTSGCGVGTGMVWQVTGMVLVMRPSVWPMLHPRHSHHPSWVWPPWHVSHTPYMFCTLLGGIWWGGFLFHVHAWLSSSLSSNSIGECSWHPPLLGEPLGSSSSLGQPIWSSLSPGFGGFLFILLWYCFVFSAGSGSGGCWSLLVYFFPLLSITISVISGALIFTFWLPLSLWCHHHSFWQIPPSLDVAQHQVIIKGLQLIAVGYKLPCGIP